jgi:hypothetical protein
MAGKRPRPRPPVAGSPIRNAAPAALEAAAKSAIYVGSEKHKFGSFEGRVGRPGPRPTSVEQAAKEAPVPPFTMICPAKWNNRDPAQEATQLLRAAILKGQVGHPFGEDGLPQYVWARDPEDSSMVYEARRMTFPWNGYKAYPLIAAQISQLGIVPR